VDGLHVRIQLVVEISFIRDIDSLVFKIRIKSIFSPSTIGRV